MAALVNFPPFQRDLNINDLSEDCLLHIFGFITNVREKIRLKRVCKMWTLLVYRSLAYHHIDLTRADHIYFTSEIENFKRSLRSVDKNDADKYDFELRKQLAKYSRFPMSKILFYCRNLRKFHNVITERHIFQLNPYYDWQMNEDGWATLQLTEIKIWNDDSITDELLSMILSKCSKLETLDLCGCRNVGGSCLQYVSDSLKKLKLVNCPIETQNLSDWIQKSGQNLRVITLYCKTLKIHCILQNVGLVCPCIKVIDVCDQSN